MHLPHLIHDLAIILGMAGAVTLLFRRIRQPVVLGYIVAGLIVGPFTPLSAGNRYPQHQDLGGTGGDFPVVRPGP